MRLCTVAPIHMVVVFTTVGSLPVQIPLLSFLQSLFVGTVLKFWNVAAGMEDGPGHCAEPVRLATALVE